jgi:hypothetical protein
MKTVLLLAFSFAPALVGQSAAPSATPARPAGVPADWDVRRTLDSLQTQTRRLPPLLARMNPDVWVKMGAPYSYVEQKKTAENEIQYFNTSADSLARDPDKLSQALDTYFRLEALDTELSSLINGVRKYDNPAVADIMQAVLNEGSRNTTQFRQYITDLAAQREHEYQVMDHEAQRCRGVISRQPAAGGRSK